MFEKCDKKRLYWLMGQYVSNKITARTFCDEFYYCYDLELNSNELDDKEQRAFSRLSIVINRFSEFKEEHILYPGTYFDESQLHKKVIETINSLKEANI